MSYTPHPGLHPDKWRRLLKHGHVGADVAAWQAVLEVWGYGVTDQVGDFKDSTHNATLAFQKLRGLGVDGKVGNECKSNITKAPIERVIHDDTLDGHDLRGLYAFTGCLDSIPFVGAKNYTEANRHPGPFQMNWIVIHSMEGAEAATKAETVARWFAGENKRFAAPRSSAHYAIDCNSIVQMVREKDVAWAAPGANRAGVHLEHAGRSRQTRAQWLDAFSRPMLMQSAWLAARMCIRWKLPVVFVDADEVSSGRRGITTHRATTHAFKKSTHTDPGPNFPMDWYLACVREAHAVLMAE